MAWYNPLTWGEKAATNILDKDSGLLTQVGGWVGNMNLTQEELIEFNAKTVGNVHEFVKATLSESTERSKTRRSIAIMWIKLQVSLVLLCCIAAPFDSVLASFYLDLATSSLMFTVTTAICIFFFGSHGLARLQENKK
jgi:hypothetical protein